MDELIVKRLRGEATDFEIRQLDRWRAESTENERAYSVFAALWHGTGEPVQHSGHSAPAVEEIVTEANARRARDKARGAGRPLLRLRWTGLGLAAAAVTAMVLWGFPSDTGRTTGVHGLFPVESSSRLEDVTTLVLSDGSVLRMQPETRAEFPPSRDRREVVLEGKAFFAVVADSMPFVVRTPVGRLLVRGTRFEVRAGSEDLTVTVVEGRVRLEAESGSVELGPSQIARLRPGSVPQVEDASDVWSGLEWPSGLLIYEATPLSEVAAELGRHFGRDVEFVDSTLKPIQITAWFEDESLEEVLSAVCLVAGVPCEVGEEGITIG